MTPARRSLVVDYGAFREPPSLLFRDYFSNQPGVRPFFAPGDGWGLAAVEAAAARALAFPRRPDTLARALVRQQELRGAPGAAAKAERLARPDALAVVTGQQPGLFGGPLYVLYKALAALKVAAQLEERRGTPVVPVFWVAADDHDFAEVRQTTVLDESGRLRTLRYSPAREPAGQPLSGVLLDESITALIEELRRALPENLHRDALLERLAACYRPGASFSGAFAAFLSSLLPSLVVLDPSDPAVKALMAPVLSREIQERSPSSQMARRAGEGLLAAGYHQQVPLRPGFLNLFVVLEGERRALAVDDGSLEVRGLGRRIPLAEAVHMLAEDPAPWSPGALLRPLAQDLILPTAAYVGGPAEIAYHAQIGPSYAHFGIPRPTLLPRPGVTLVEPGPARALEAEGLLPPDLQDDPEAILARWVQAAHPQVDAAFARTREALAREMDAVEQTLGGLDPTLAGAADAARGRAQHQIQGLYEKATRVLKKRDQERAERLRRTRDALFPGGSLQERGLGLLGPVARHGEGLIEDVLESMDPWAQGHQFVWL
jgi:bacillithiol biosynthesis cysteine-adding enzyme BshC